VKRDSDGSFNGLKKNFSGWSNQQQQQHARKDSDGSIGNYLFPPPRKVSDGDVSLGTFIRYRADSEGGSVFRYRTDSEDGSIFRAPSGYSSLVRQNSGFSSYNHSIMSVMESTLDGTRGLGENCSSDEEDSSEYSEGGSSGSSRWLSESSSEEDLSVIGGGGVRRKGDGEEETDGLLDVTIRWDNRGGTSFEDFKKKLYNDDEKIRKNWCKNQKRMRSDPEKPKLKKNRNDNRSRNKLRRSGSYSSIGNHFNNQNNLSSSSKEPFLLPPFQILKDLSESFWDAIYKLEVCIANFPSLVGALALAWSSMGCDWFKFAEETLPSCTPVDFHNPLCTFPEFPGCFSCPDDNWYYRSAVYFHFFCSAVSAAGIVVFVLKMIVAFPVVKEELSHPTTAAPAGLICMATFKVFSGWGWEGEVLVVSAAVVHMVLAMWFVFISMAYSSLPDPGWYPNTTGVGLAAVKMFLYFPIPAMGLMGISIVCLALFFPISVLRVFANRSISAPKAFVQMSGPAVVLYGLTIMSQPSTVEEELALLQLKDDIHESRYWKLHQQYYLPIMHFIFALTMIGAISAIHAVAVRWKDFKDKEFSPAHASFCAPLLSHVNAVQAYRGVVNKYGTRVPKGGFLKLVLYNYWLFTLIIGTLLTIYVTHAFLCHLPEWVNPYIEDDEIPPEPNETLIAKIITDGSAQDKIVQPYTSAAILQANETGSLMRVMRRRGDKPGTHRYVRSRRMPSIGFDPTLNWKELDLERELMLDYVANHSPRRRSRTLSIPHLFGGSKRQVRDEEEGGDGRGSGRRDRPYSMEFFWNSIR